MFVYVAPPLILNTPPAGAVLSAENVPVFEAPRLPLPARSFTTNLRLKDEPGGVKLER